MRISLAIPLWWLFYTFSCVVANVEKGGALWPMPQAIVIGTERVVVSKDLNITTNLPDCEIVNSAIKRYTKLINNIKCTAVNNPGVFKPRPKLRKYHKVHRSESNVNDVELTELRIVIRGACEKYPSEDMDERYVIQVHTPSMEFAAELTAGSVWGAIRGLETISQLMYEEDDGAGGIKVLINSTAVIDFPRFSFRGLLLDTSRHFIPLTELLENLEAMSQNKLNVFHWHIVDDQSFPYESKLFPNMSVLGAFDKNHIYSQDEIAELIEFARVRGIRVLPEFDSPGHTQSWGKDQTGLLTPCYRGGVPDGTYGPINPIKNDTYDFLTKFLGEIAQVFPDKYLHLGGDEVEFACWQSNPDILAFMKKHNITGDFSKLEQIYEQNVVDIVQRKLGKNTIVWQEVLDNQVHVNKDTVVHVWKDGYESELAKVTAAGYKTILSSCWYLNYISYGADWHAYYACDPQAFNGTNDQKNLVMGGAVAMWGEYVDGTQVITRTWPRASAVAERLWSSQTLTDVDQAAPRLDAHRCRMLKRGIRVEPTNGPGYCVCDPFV